MNRPFFLLTAALSLTAIAQEKPAADKPAPKKELGYKTTPIIPGTKWHVHDGDRPQPPIVTPGEFSTQEKVGTAPSDATVLFDGKDLSQWRSGDGKDAKWKVENGYIEVAPKTGDIFTKGEFGPDVQFHIEFATPPPAGDGQGRGNSGAFLFGRYEIQILDSYNNPTYPDGQATAIYSQTPPLSNASLKPGAWQVYDIIFNGPRFNADGTVAKPADTTILHNGVVTQNHTILTGDTPHQAVGKYHKHPEKGPIKLQDHNNAMRFRNIWIRELKNIEQAPASAAPAAPAK